MFRCLFVSRANSLESKPSHSVTFTPFDILLSYTPVTSSDSFIFPIKILYALLSLPHVLQAVLVLSLPQFDQLLCVW